MAKGLFTLTAEILEVCTLQENTKSDGEYEGYFSIDDNEKIPEDVKLTVCEDADTDFPGIKSPAFGSADINYVYNEKRKTLELNFMPSVYDAEDDSEWAEPSDMEPYDLDATLEAMTKIVEEIKTAA